jgi:hypothetical protein
MLFDSLLHEVWCCSRSGVGGAGFTPAAGAIANAAVLPGRRAAPKVYVGAATWGAASWAGKLYPPKTPASRFRSLYPNFFNAIELNATHYTFYAPEVIRQWAAAAEGKEFKFCPKFPQAISHHGDFKNVQAQSDAFWKVYGLLKNIWDQLFCR